MNRREEKETVKDHWPNTWQGKEEEEEEEEEDDDDDDDDDDL